ncbi:hypothetical protein V6N13_113751 [Hibiscus sabdariffa]
MNLFVPNIYRRLLYSSSIDDFKVYSLSINEKRSRMQRSRYTRGTSVQGSEPLHAFNSFPAQLSIDIRSENKPYYIRSFRRSVETALSLS